jgi:glycosyltransferase involved in cell wall biosynthesis
MPHVIVIIPAGDAAPLLGDTSALGETCRDLEVAVVDDGSRDAAPAIVGAAAATDGPVRLIREADAGVATARNRVLAAGGDRRDGGR